MSHTCQIFHLTIQAKPCAVFFRNKPSFLGPYFFLKNMEQNIQMQKGQNISMIKRDNKCEFSEKRPKSPFSDFLIPGHYLPELNHLDIMNYN